MEEINYPGELGPDLLQLLDKRSKKIEKAFKIKLSIRGDKLMFSGSAHSMRKFFTFTDNLFAVAKNRKILIDQDLDLALNMASAGLTGDISREMKTRIRLKLNGREVHPRTLNQKKYMQAIMDHDLTFAIGPAGTGKTYLAIAVALHYLITKSVERIVLTRPVVEAGEKLGFLPGDIQQKVNPYFRPLYDALYDLIGFERTADLIEKEIIEIAPLAYMRGRTINNAFIILDEGQNTLGSQMKMFLTRFGNNSRVVVTADISQIDLPHPKQSGIFSVIKILNNIPGIMITSLSARDVVRHPLVKKIIDAYENASS